MRTLFACRYSYSPKKSSTERPIFLLEPLREIRPHVADRRVHRVVARAGVDAPPRDLHIVHPLRQLTRAPGMHTEIPRQILLRLALVVAVVACVEDQDVTFLHIH